MTESEENISASQAPRQGIFLSPEGFIMMSLAVIVDIGELFIPLEPIDPLDIFALIFFGAWMFFRSGQIRVSKKSTAAVKQITSWAKRLKWLKPLLFITEMIPVIGAAPCWIIAVYLELKYNK